MNVKIQGGGAGTYANVGSCTGVVSYLQHEDIERMKQAQDIEPFFNQGRNQVSPQEVTYKIDHNRAQLHKTDAKFFVITVSPSERELAMMGATPQVQAATMKEYIRGDVMQQYAEGFGKGLKAENIEYYAKVHFSRDKAGVTDMHAHIIVSRKDVTNKLKLSPQTNHRKAGKGVVKSGFDRSGFFRKCETSFDIRTGYQRSYKERFEYLNAMKNGTAADIQQQTAQAVRAERAAEKVLQNEIKVTKKISKVIGGRSL